MDWSDCGCDGPRFVINHAQARRVRLYQSAAVIFLMDDRLSKNSLSKGRELFDALQPLIQARLGAQGDKLQRSIVVTIVECAAKHQYPPGMCLPRFAM